MNTIITAVIPGQSGQPNQFQVATQRNDAGKIIGVDVQVVQFGDSTDLSRANLSRVLTIQKELVKTKDAQFTIKKYIALVDLGADVTFTLPNPKSLNDMSVANKPLFNLPNMADTLPSIAQKINI